MSAKSKLAIAYVLDDSMDSTDGVQQYVRTVSDWMQAEGHTCHFIVGHSRKDDPTTHSMSSVVRLSFNKNRVATPLPARKKRIQEVMTKTDFDVLHVQMPYSPLLAGKIVHNAPSSAAVVGTFHILPYGTVHHAANKALGHVLRPSLKRFDEIVSVSPAAQTFAKSVYGIESSVIPNTIDARKFVTKRSLTPEKRPVRIVFLGRLVERKGVMELLRALSVLQVEYPQVAAKIECIIGGSGKLAPALKRYAHEHKLDHMVEFIGFVPEEDKAKLLASADIAVFPALGGESFGIVLIEAMAAGSRVVLGGDNPGYRSVLGERPELLVNPKDSRQFAQTLVKLLTDNNLRQTVFRWQTRTVRQYDIAVVGPKLVSLYEQALAKRRKVSS